MCWLTLTLPLHPRNNGDVQTVVLVCIDLIGQGRLTNKLNLLASSAPRLNQSRSSQLFYHDVWAASSDETTIISVRGGAPDPGCLTQEHPRISLISDVISVVGLNFGRCKALGVLIPRFLAPFSTIHKNGSSSLRILLLRVPSPHDKAIRSFRAPGDSAIGTLSVRTGVINFYSEDPQLSLYIPVTGRSFSIKTHVPPDSFDARLPSAVPLISKGDQSLANPLANPPVRLRTISPSLATHLSSAPINQTQCGRVVPSPFLPSTTSVPSTDAN
ncbi:hypothetical protein BS47DRAFT_1389986 [Hydnum rufescens UP504]|uniref:Uncharacterized protein n=1 Tax=Hydnum rufescens UP504 TaxID=1448309 RepID=A0A9P6B3V2_9AGAM|nr:hypothetical protein BS47DRAFT_1389986 [Hydnum rufescens UP504]